MEHMDIITGFCGMETGDIENMRLKFVKHHPKNLISSLQNQNMFKIIVFIRIHNEILVIDVYFVKCLAALRRRSGIFVFAGAVSCMRACWTFIRAIA